MNYGELKDSIRFKVDDLRGTRFTTEQIRLAINESYKHVYRELIKQNTFTAVKSTEITFVSGSQEITFDFDVSLVVQKIVHVQDSNGFPIPIYSEALSKRSNVRSVYLKRFDSDGKEALKLGWYVCPTSTFTLSLEWASTFTDFTKAVRNIDASGFVPQEHHDVVVLRATLLLLATDEDKAQIWFPIYMDALNSMKESVELNNDEVDTVVDLQTEDHYASNRS